MTQEWKITGGEVLTAEGMVPGEVYVTEAGLAAQAEPGARELDVSRHWILPGIVDLHGDAFEGIVQPRAGVRFPYSIAFAEADRQLLANGITTAFHALTVSWEPGLRSIETAREAIDALTDCAQRLRCDTHVNVRWETFAIDHVEEVLAWLHKRPGDILSINDHTTANRGLDETSNKLKRMAARMGTDVVEAKRLIEDIWARRSEVPDAVARICKGARSRPKPILAHDQTTIEEWSEGQALGVSVSEFPMTDAAARAARDAGEEVILGAPNALRGESHANSLSAVEAISSGLCSVLASDYYYPAPLHAAFALSDRGLLPFAKAWALVSTNPARAAGFHDRGLIAPGQRADLLVVDPASREIRMIFCDGRKVLDRE